MRTKNSSSKRALQESQAKLSSQQTELEQTNEELEEQARLLENQKDLTERKNLEFLELLQYLTIPVSEMFRDPPYFASLRENVLPFLQTYPSLKVWVAGCSTGEEAYSMAILLKEEGLLERSIIYATDINPFSLRKAEQGMYSLDQGRIFSENYQKSGGKGSLSDHFISDEESILFDRLA